MERYREGMAIYRPGCGPDSPTETEEGARSATTLSPEPQPPGLQSKCSRLKPAVYGALFFQLQQANTHHVIAISSVFSPGVSLLPGAEAWKAGEGLGSFLRSEQAWNPGFLAIPAHPKPHQGSVVPLKIHQLICEAQSVTRC